MSAVTPCCGGSSEYCSSESLRLARTLLSIEAANKTTRRIERRQHRQPIQTNIVQTRVAREQVQEHRKEG